VKQRDDLTQHRYLPLPNTSAEDSGWLGRMPVLQRYWDHYLARSAQMMSKKTPTSRSSMLETTYMVYLQRDLQARMTPPTEHVLLQSVSRIHALVCITFLT